MCRYHMWRYLWNNDDNCDDGDNDYDGDGDDNDYNGDSSRKECVICLENDSYGKPLQNINKLMYNRSCKCSYLVHKECFDIWVLSHYCKPNDNEINCLVCNSIGKKVIPIRHSCAYNIGFMEMIVLFFYYNIYL